MNEVFGVDPSAPRDLKDLKALFTRFGLTQGRFIARYPADWEREVIETFQNLSDIDRARLTRLIQINRDALLASTASFNRTKSWVRNVAELRGRDRIFSRVLAVNPNDERFDTLDSYLWESDDNEFSSSRGGFIEMTPEAYARVCLPLFGCSSEVHICDRFFQLRNAEGSINRRRWSVLRALAAQAIRSPRCREFVLHFERPPATTRAYYEDRLVGDLTEVADEYCLGISYHIHDTMHHGRYVFSIKGGLQFDYGLEVGLNQRNHIHWLSTSELDHLHREYGLAIVGLPQTKRRN